MKVGEAAGYRHETEAAGEQDWNDHARWFGSEYTNPDTAGVWVSLPFWFLGSFFALLSVISCGLRRLRFTAARGYPITQNTSGVCPECRTPVAKELAEKSRRTA
jgi:hypothetical protein